MQLSVTTFRPSNIISMVTLPRTATLLKRMVMMMTMEVKMMRMKRLILIHPDYDDDDTNADDEYDADKLVRFSYHSFISHS